MDLICDTNVWYDLGDGKRDPAVLRRGGHRLLATPVSFVEISSKVSMETFLARSRAARAVVDHADGVLVDTDRHLASIWNLPVEPLSVDWLGGFKALATARDLEELLRGVPDHQSGLTRALHIEIAAGIRAQWDAFVLDVQKLIEDYVPGYSESRGAGSPIWADGEQSERLREHVNDPRAALAVVFGTRDRAAINMTSAYRGPTVEEVVRAGETIIPYVRAYLRYVLNCGTRYLPKKNDWGDLECFAYLQENRRLLTRDARWLEIAKDIGLEDWLLDPEV